MLAAFIGVPCGRATAQEVEGAPAGTPAAPDVYINDSFEAADAISAARKQADASNWDEAAELMQRAARNFGDRLIKSSGDVYITIREHVNELVCAWPDAGLSAYRELFERELVDKLEEASATASFNDELLLFEQYFCTSKAAELADLVAQAAIESGDFAVARRVYSRVLKQHPHAAKFADRYRGMQALVAAMNGTPLSEIPDYNTETNIRWMGEERRMGDVIAAWTQARAAVKDEAFPNDWPTLAGHPTRNRLASCQVDELGLLWRYVGFGDPRPSRGGDVEDEGDGDKREVVRFLSMQPVVQGNLMYLQDRREIVALNRNTGFTAWRFRPEDADSGGVDDFDEQAPAADGVTVAEGRVVAALPGDAGPYSGYDGSRTQPELVCLDAVTGKLLWRVGQESIGETFAEMSFDTSPLVDRGRVYVVARRRRSFGFEDAYLLRLDAASGAVEFRTHLGSASTGSFGFKRATTAIPALDGDVVYVCTNLGTVAAVSADTGTIRWLRLYARDAQNGAMESTWSLRTPSSWAFNPAIVSAGRVFVRPLDASEVLVLSVEDGKIIRSISARDLSGAETILGVHNDIVCTAGAGVSCYDVSAGGVLWSIALDDAWRLSGRGQWMDDKLLIPTRTGLSTFYVTSGERRDAVWDAQGHGGNILALPEQLFVVADSSISSYVRKTDLWNSLRARMTSAASDPLPALEFAEIALRGGDDREALRLLDEAVNRTDRRSEPPEPTLKQRMFDDLVLFADTLADRGTLTVDDLDHLCVLAARFAPDPAGNLKFRLRCGSHFERFDKPEQALALYQQVLRDRSLRTLTPEAATRRAALTQPVAAAVAQTRIAALMEKHGPAVYAPYDAESRRWLDAGRAARDVDQLTRVMETFPNSSAAGESMVAVGEIARDDGKFAEAAQILARAFHRYGTTLDRPRVIAQIADAYGRAERPAAAYRWATKGVREFGETLVERNGQWMTFRELRTALTPSESAWEATRPRLAPPLNEVKPSSLPEGAVILAPEFGDQPGADWSRCYVSGSDGIHAYAAATAHSLWELPAPVRGTPELLVARADYAVFATRFEIFALDAATGTRRWTHGSIPADDADPQRDWEGVGALQNHAVQDDQLVSVRDNKRMSSISLATGAEMWTRDIKMLPAGRLRLADPWIIYHAMLDGPTALCQVNAATGDWVGMTVTDETRPIEDLYVALDGQVIFVTSQSIASYDVDAGVRRWRVNFEGQLRQSSLRLDVDAVYFTQDGDTVRKIALHDGALTWESPSVMEEGGDDITIERHGKLLVVSSQSSISALDELTGAMLWKGTTPAEVRFVRRFVNQQYASCMHLGSDGAESAVYFYDLREFSGVIPEKGGILPLGIVENFRGLVVFDGGMVMQEVGGLRWWGQ